VPLSCRAPLDLAVPAEEFKFLQDKGSSQFRASTWIAHSLGEHMNPRNLLRRLWLPRVDSTHYRAGATGDTVNLARILGERFSIESQDVHFASSNAYRKSWVDWRDSLRQLGIDLCYIGRRGHASLRNGKQLLVRLDSGQWQVQQESPGGWEIVAGDWGRTSLRAYLIKDSPPPHPLFEKK